MSRTSLPGERDGIGLQGAQRVQVVGTVGVEHALGRAGGAGGVAEPGRSLFIEATPRSLDTMRFEQGLVTPHLRPVTAQHIDWRHRLAVHDDDMLETRTQRRQLGQKRREARGHGEGAVFCFVDHRSEVGHGQARIQRVADHAGAHERVIHFQMMLSVPAERADAIAESQLKRRQRARQRVASRP